MKASELRIGNYYNQFENTEKVSWSTLKTLEESTTEQLWCKPIPLTDEWLLKFGFEKDGDSFIYGNGWLIVDFPTVHYSFDIWTFNENYPTTSDWTEIPSNIEYVHQLQNLYFALTNEELKLTK